MKKLFYLSVLLLFFLCNDSIMYSQNAYYDALKIDFLKNRSEKESVLGLNFQNFKDFTTNPFTNKPNELTLDKVRSAIKIDKNGNFTINSAAASQGMSSSLFSPSNQAAIIDGTAKFIAERFKEDVTSIYINKFRDRLENIPELKALLPKTYTFLKTVDVFNYRSLGNDYKEAFEADLKNILGNLRTYINLDTNKVMKKNLDSVGIYQPFDFALALSDKLVNGYHLVEILDFLENTYKNDTNFQDYYNFIHGINIIQKNLQRGVDQTQNYSMVPQFNNIWLKFSDLHKLDSPDKIKYFLALIYHEDESFFKDTLKIDPNKPEEIFKNIIYPIAALLNNIENIQSKEKQMTGDDYIEIMANTLKLLKLVNDKSSKHFADITITNDKQEIIETINALDLIEKTVDLYKSIYKKNYGTVITNSVYITEKLLKAGGKSNANVIKVTQAIKQYGGFMVDIVTAENSDDVKDAIKNNVTKYSYLEKRNSLSNLTLSAHPGVFVGAERLSVNYDEWKANIGITCPIGFEWMWGMRRIWSDSKSTDYAFVKKDKVKHLSGHAWSLFFQILDIGAVFSYRLDDSENELPEEITLKQVFSPGFSINYAIKNSPLTIGAGVQYIPELRKVTVDNLETGSNSLRFMLRCSWDIPMVKIYGQKVEKISN